MSEAGTQTQTAPSTPSWMADLPEELRTNPTIQSFKGDDWKTVGPVIAKSFVETKAMTGRKAYDLPSEDWKPEQWQAWHKSIGVPDAPDRYPVIDQALAEKAGMTQETLSAAFKKFHEVGMTPRQVKAILNDWYVPEAVKGSELMATQRQAETAIATQALKQEFGDKFDAKMGLAKAFLTKFGSPELIEWADKSGAGNQPEFVKALIKASEAMLEDSSTGGRAGRFSEAGSKGEALQKILEIKNDKGFMERFMSGQKDAVKMWNDLHQIAYK